MSTLILKCNKGICGGKLSWQPHADGNDRRKPRDAGERHACQIPRGR